MFFLVLLHVINQTKLTYDMKNQSSTSAKMFLKKFTVARLIGFASNDTVRNMTDSETTVNTSIVCKALTL
jgi:hypothetical protein